MDEIFSFQKEKSCFEIKQDDLEKFAQASLNSEDNHIVDEQQSGYDDSRWAEKSKSIKARDNFTCQLCHAFNPSLEGHVILQQGDYETIHNYYWAGDNYYEIYVHVDFPLTITFHFSPGFHLVMPRLNVHHKVYYRNRKIWDYQDEELVTLCESCHHYVHSLKDIGIPIVEQDANGKITLVGRTTPKLYNPKIDHSDLGTFKPLTLVEEYLWENGLHGQELADFKKAKSEKKPWYNYHDMLNDEVMSISYFTSYDKSINNHTPEEIKVVVDYIVKDFIENILGFRKKE